MNKETRLRLEALEQRFEAAAEARRRRRASARFWRDMKALGDRVGLDLLAGAFPRGYDPTAPPRRQRTVADQVQECLDQAHEAIAAAEAGRTAGQAETRPAGEPAPTAAAPHAPGPAGPAHADRDGARDEPEPPPPPDPLPSSRPAPATGWVRFPAVGFGGRARGFMGVGG